MDTICPLTLPRRVAGPGRPEPQPRPRRQPAARGGAGATGGGCSEGRPGRRCRVGDRERPALRRRRLRARARRAGGRRGARRRGVERRCFVGRAGDGGGGGEKRRCHRRGARERAGAGRGARRGGDVELRGGAGAGAVGGGDGGDHPPGPAVDRAGAWVQNLWAPVSRPIPYAFTPCRRQASPPPLPQPPKNNHPPRPRPRARCAIPWGPARSPLCFKKPSLSNPSLPTPTPTNRQTAGHVAACPACPLLRFASSTPAQQLPPQPHPTPTTHKPQAMATSASRNPVAASQVLSQSFVQSVSQGVTQVGGAGYTKAADGAHICVSHVFTFVEKDARGETWREREHSSMECWANRLIGTTTPSAPPPPKTLRSRSPRPPPRRSAWRSSRAPPSRSPHPWPSPRPTPRPRTRPPPRRCAGLTRRQEICARGFVSRGTTPLVRPSAAAPAAAVGLQAARAGAAGPASQPAPQQSPRPRRHPSPSVPHPTPPVPPPSRGRAHASAARAQALAQTATQSVSQGVTQSFAESQSLA